ncbi:hypothetical protein ULMA_14510 [Patiriisocius marinus]|uniref:Calx-beta domain-containing protein n=2 Tax=Patiriisocius marinus TaxID=1397112 RepID=A0A5J4J0N5_9FLAO|nr:hypothetical protein ULMA_14510 [Patiriisocius marinus]
MALKNTILLTLLIMSISAFSQVGIGTTSPSDAAMLEVNSSTDGGITYQGFMPPRIPTTLDLNNMSPDINDAGLQVFVLETGCLNIWNGVAWFAGPCVAVVSGSEIEFSSATQSQSEGVSSIDFSFTVLNPSSTAPIQLSIAADVYTDLDESVAQTVIIPANLTSYTATAVFNITDDVMAESNEDVVFTMSYLSGGLGTTTVGVQNTNTLTIIDDDSALTLPFQESFETLGNGVRYTTTEPESFRTGNNDDYFSRAQDSDFSGYTGGNSIQYSGMPDGNFYFAAQDIDGAPSTTGPTQTLNIDGIDITGGFNLEFDVLLAEDDDGASESWDGDDYVIFEYQIDGGGWQNLLAVESVINGTNGSPAIDSDFDNQGDAPIITDSWTNFNANIIGTGNVLDLRIRFSLNSDNEDIFIDNIRVTSN